MSFANHFGVPSPGAPSPVWPPLWASAIDDGLAPIEWYYATETAGPGLTHPKTANWRTGNYISSTPVVSEAALGLDGPAQILEFPSGGVQPFYVAGGTDPGVGLPPRLGGGRLYVYNPSSADTVACLLWLGGPQRWLIEPTAGVNGVELCGSGGAYFEPWLTLTGVPASQSTPHLLGGGSGTWATDHRPGASGYDVTDGGAATANNPPASIGATALQKRKPYGPSSYDPAAPVPRFALEFALLPHHCLPVSLTRNVALPTGSAYDDPYSFYVEVHVLRTTVV